MKTNTGFGMAIGLNVQSLSARPCRVHRQKFFFPVGRIDHFEHESSRCSSQELRHPVHRDDGPCEMPIRVTPNATAGLKAAPELFPTANAPVVSVTPIVSP